MDEQEEIELARRNYLICNSCDKYLAGIDTCSVDMTYLDSMNALTSKTCPLGKWEV